MKKLNRNKNGMIVFNPKKWWSKWKKIEEIKKKHDFQSLAGWDEHKYRGNFIIWDESKPTISVVVNNHVPISTVTSGTCSHVFLGQSYCQQLWFIGPQISKVGIEPNWVPQNGVQRTLKVAQEMDFIPSVEPLSLSRDQLFYRPLSNWSLVTCVKSNRLDAGHVGA